MIGDASVVTSGVRYFDFLTAQTVDVTQIAGGNPLLLAERATTRQLGLIAGPFQPMNLVINAEYSRIVTRNSVSSLPPASAAILLAFPDRFQRDANGALTVVDIRSVNFSRQRFEQFRYGFSLAVPIVKGTAGVTPSRTINAPGEVDGTDMEASPLLEIVPPMIVPPGRRFQMPGDAPSCRVVPVLSIVPWILTCPSTAALIVPRFDVVWAPEMLSVPVLTEMPP